MKNFNIIITAMATLFWFKGMYRILDYIIPDTIYYSVSMSLIALFIFYFNDGELNELGKVNDAAYQPRDKKSENIE
jgi:hypothetical protein